MHAAFFFLALLALSAAEVTVLTPDTFDDFVGGDKAAIVAFTAPWCGHCKNLHPEYEVVGSTFKESDGVVIANVDADAHRDLGSKFGVTGFPTIKWFPKGETEPVDFTGGRTADDIVSFINKEAGLNRKVKKAPTVVTELTPANFEAIALDPKKDVLVEFFAPWCGHCKALAPVYESVAQTYQADENVVVASVDADKHRDLGGEYGVTGFPTIKFFARGDDKEAEDYTAGRDAESFIDFLNEAAGTKRVLGGGLTDDAGRLADYDVFAAKFMAAGKKERATILKEAESALDVLTEEEAVGGNIYVKAMKKITKKGDAYVETEIARLTGMIESGAVSPAKKTFFMTRKNVLAAFQEEDEE